jgi:hypothetical protein
MTSLLSPEDLEVVHETLQEIRDMPPPRDNHATGCLMSIGGLVVLLGLPALGRVMTISQGLGTVGLLIGGASLALGIIVWMTAGGFVRGQSFAAAEAALRELEGWGAEEGDREVALRAATLLLTHAVVQYGPTSTSTFERAEAEVRLAPMMPLVMAVQEVLVEEEAAYPIFGTEEENDSDEPHS